MLQLLIPHSQAPLRKTPRSENCQRTGERERREEKECGVFWTEIKWEEKSRYAKKRKSSQERLHDKCSSLEWIRKCLIRRCQVESKLYSKQTPLLEAILIVLLF